MSSGEGMFGWRKSSLTSKGMNIGGNESPDQRKTGSGTSSKNGAEIDDSISTAVGVINDLSDQVKIGGKSLLQTAVSAYGTAVEHLNNSSCTISTVGGNTMYVARGDNDRYITAENDSEVLVNYDQPGSLPRGYGSLRHAVHRQSSAKKRGASMSALSCVNVDASATNIASPNRNSISDKKFLTAANVYASATNTTVIPFRTVSNSCNFFAVVVENKSARTLELKMNGNADSLRVVAYYFHAETPKTLNCTIEWSRITEKNIKTPVLKEVNVTTSNYEISADDIGFKLRVLFTRSNNSSDESGCIGYCELELGPFTADDKAYKAVQSYIRNRKAVIGCCFKSELMVRNLNEILREQNCNNLSPHSNKSLEVSKGRISGRDGLYNVDCSIEINPNGVYVLCHDESKRKWQSEFGEQGVRVMLKQDVREFELILKKENGNGFYVLSLQAYTRHLRDVMVLTIRAFDALIGISAAHILDSVLKQETPNDSDIDNVNILNLISRLETQSRDSYRTAEKLAAEKKTLTKEKLALEQDMNSTIFGFQEQIDILLNETDHNNPNDSAELQKLKIEHDNLQKELHKVKNLLANNNELQTLIQTHKEDLFAAKQDVFNLQQRLADSEAEWNRKLNAKQNQLVELEKDFNELQEAFLFLKSDLDQAQKCI